MNSRTRTATIASALALSLLASIAHAKGSAADTHAYLEGQRTITDGQTTPAPRRAADSRATAATVTEADRQFLFGLSRTDGNAEPVSMVEAARRQQRAWRVDRPRAER